MLLRMKNTRYELYSCLWELTLKCNLNCMHCGSVAGSAKLQELTLSECYRIADEIIDLNCKELTLIGGEIFLYSGWEKVAGYLSKRGIMVNIITNGYRVDKKEIDQIKYANLTNVGVSIDGNELIHNLIRRNKHSFEHIRKTLDLLNLADIPIGVITSLIEMNYPEMEPVYQFLIQNNVKVWQIQLVNPMGNMAGKNDLILDRKHIPSLIDFIREKNKDRKILVLAADNIGYYYDDSESYIRGASSPFCFWQGCQAGLSTVFIDSTGNVKGCGALYADTFIEGNLKKNSLAEIWNNQDNFSYNRKFKTELLEGGCRDCDIGDVCKGGCRASDYFNTGSLYENAFCAHRIN